MAEINLEKALSYKNRGVHTVLLQVVDAFHGEEGFKNAGQMIDAYAFPNTLKSDTVVVYLPSHDRLTIYPLSENFKVIKLVKAFINKQAEAEQVLVTIEQARLDTIEVVKKMDAIADPHMRQTMVACFDSLMTGIEREVDMSEDDYDRFVIWASLVERVIDKKSSELILGAINRYYKRVCDREAYLEAAEAIDVHNKLATAERNSPENTQKYVEYLKTVMNEEQLETHAVFVRMKMLATAMIVGQRSMYLRNELKEALMKAFPLLDPSTFNMESAIDDGIRKGLEEKWFEYDMVTETYKLTVVGGGSVIEMMKRQADEAKRSGEV